MTSLSKDYGLEKYRRVDVRMINGIMVCTVGDKYLKELDNYLGKNSAEYAFSAKKGEEKAICFIDNQKRIFAILNPDKKEVELAPYVDLKILGGVEKILFSGGRE